MGQATRKLPQPDTSSDMDQPTSSSKEKTTKTPQQPKSRNGGKVPKKTLNVKRPLKRSSSKNALNKTTNSVKRPKKAGATVLFSHYHKLNETLNQREPDQDEEKVEKPTTSSSDLSSE
ncbi:uncharacterized protein LOC144218023 [Crocuta crocuta]